MNFPQKKTNIRFPISESSAESETARLIAHFHDPSLAGRNGLRLLDVDAEEVVVEASAEKRPGAAGWVMENTWFFYTRHIGKSRTFIIGLYLSSGSFRYVCFILFLHDSKRILNSQKDRFPAV